MIRELLLPRTDAGVAVQAAVAVAVYTALLVAVRSQRELRSFVVGLATITAAWFGLRALH